MRNNSDKSNRIYSKGSSGSNIKPSKQQVRKIEKKPVSMHENVPIWYDCCSCEAEPYWLDAMEAEGNKKLEP